MSKQNTSASQVDGQSSIIRFYIHEKGFNCVSRGQPKYRQPFVFDSVRLIDTSAGDSWSASVVLTLEVGPDYSGVIEAINAYLDYQVAVGYCVTLQRRQYWVEVVVMFEGVQRSMDRPI